MRAKLKRLVNGMRPDHKLSEAYGMSKCLQGSLENKIHSKFLCENEYHEKIRDWK
jgi:hypothetical protein